MTKKAKSRAIVSDKEAENFEKKLIWEYNQYVSNQRSNQPGEHVEILPFRDWVSFNIYNWWDRLADDYVDRHTGENWSHLNWDILTQTYISHADFKMSWVEKYKDKIDWAEMTMVINWDEPLARQFATHLDWAYLRIDDNDNKDKFSAQFRKDFASQITQGAEEGAELFPIEE